MAVTDSSLQFLLSLPVPLLWILFFVENIIITGLVLLAGRWLQRYDDVHVISEGYTRQEWTMCAITNVLNTVVTYAGFWLWKHGFIIIDETLSWRILLDFIILFFAMDFLMYVFHYIIHKTFLFKAIHSLHHEAVHPKPIDLFVLHPLETIAFGGLWLVLLVCYPFYLLAIAVYLVVNVLFGLIGHLGWEPLPAALKRTAVFQFIGTSSFHHDHHQNVDGNFGFYTSLWDRLFGTLHRS